MADFVLVGRFLCRQWLQSGVGCVGRCGYPWITVACRSISAAVAYCMCCVLVPLDFGLSRFRFELILFGVWFDFG